MSEFKRGIANPNFITKLNSDKHWQQFVRDADLFIAIRNEYINVYYYGQSICKVEFVKNKIKWTSHKKYLGIDESGYIETGVYLDKIEELKQNARKHGGKEKEQVKKHILENKELCILDVEITFGKEEGYGKRSIDYLAIEKNSDGKITLVFYEAKHFDNPEIRARENPKVFEQIEKYEIALTAHKDEILKSYKTIYKNVLELNLNNRNQLIQLIGENIENIEIDSKPRLIIFEIDANKKDDEHIQKLKKRFGEKRLILKEKNLVMENEINIKADFFTFKNSLVEQFGEQYFDQVEIFFERAMAQAKQGLLHSAIADGKFALDLSTYSNDKNGVQCLFGFISHLYCDLGQISKSKAYYELGLKLLDSEAADYEDDKEMYRKLKELIDSEDWKGTIE